jgi:asparagine synthase (glutamine-hydrolysing)
MAHSLEVRTPLVDAELTRVLARATAHAGAGDGKGWLARAPSLPLPQDVLQRPKTGFQTPVGKWLAPTGARAGDPHATGAARGHWSRRVALDVIRGPGLAA